MLTYATLERLARLGATALAEDRQLLAKAHRAPMANGTTFLSHSTRDSETYVAGATSVLKRHGATVYIDKKDPELPPYTNEATAQTLRKRIRQCSRFVLFATAKSRDSRWVPWELGLADGHKAAISVAIFPGVENSGNADWSEQEYLGIYNRVVFGPLAGEEGSVWMVWNEVTNTVTNLSKWLAG